MDNGRKGEDNETKGLIIHGKLGTTTYEFTLNESLDVGGDVMAKVVNG